MITDQEMQTPSLIELGLRPFFQQQLSLDEKSSLSVGRIVEQHRSQVIALSDQGALSLVLSPNSERVCVGDWVLFDESLRIVRVLERRSLLQRKAAGTKVDSQLIAANIDSVFIVCSLNDDFNLNRIERYLAITNEARVEPVVVLTKLDQCDDADQKRQQVQSLDPLLLVHAINALDQSHVQELHKYCSEGNTLAFLGSSGVGKSTLVNALLGQEIMQTAAIRDADSKGRHTTTHRALKWLPQGGMLMDTPGMRELKLSDCESGISETFSEIEALAQECRFNDCGHEQEPGCAVQAAIANDSLDQRRFDNYLKLMKEQAFNSATLAEKRSKDKAFGKMVSGAQKESLSRKKGR